MTPVKKTLRLPINIVGSLELEDSRTMLARNPRINDCYVLLEISAKIWRVLGLFPLTVQDTMGAKKYDINKYYAVYSFFICIACTINFICMLTVWRQEDMYMISMNLLMRGVSTLLCTLGCTIWRIFRYNELSETIESVAAQEFVLIKMCGRLNYELIAKLNRAFLWTMIMIIIFAKTYYFCTAYPFVWRSELKWLVWTVPVLIQTIDLTIFVTLIGFLGFQFRALNEKIKCVTIRANESSPKVIITSNVCAENLRLIAKTHYNMCAVGKRINRIFTFNVIIYVITGFIILSTTFYYIFVEVQRDGNTNYYRIGSYTLWILTHSITIIAIVVSCNWTSQQAIHAGKLIHKIRVEKTDSRLYQTVKSFSLQLYHQKLEFTAGGFFPLDPTLLQSIVANVTTYLVILIQFQPKLE